MCIFISYNYETHIRRHYKFANFYRLAFFSLIKRHVYKTLFL